MGSSGDVTTKKLVDRRGRKQQRLQQRNKGLRAEIEHLHVVIGARRDEHLEQLQNAKMAILLTGDELQKILDAQASQVKGFKAARERLKRGLISRLWFALRLAWRGRFA